MPSTPSTSPPQIRSSSPGAGAPTRDGVTHYDGLRWTSYTSHELDARGPFAAICVGGDGTVYAGGEQGISRFVDGRWYRVSPRDSGFYWQVRDLMVSADGSVWAATSYGALRLREQGVTLYTVEGVAQDLAEGLGPELEMSILPVEDVQTSAISYTGMGTSTIQKASLINRIVGIYQGSAADRAGVRVGDRILTVNGLPPEEGGQAAAGTFLLTLERPGVAHPIDLSVQLAQVPAGSVRREFSLEQVVEDGDGQMWLALLSGRVVSGDPATGIWQLHTSAAGLAVGAGPSLARSAEGSVWIGNWDPEQGLSTYRRSASSDGKAGHWESIRLSNIGGRNRNYGLLGAADGSLWVMGGRTLCVLRDGEWKVHRPEPFPGRPLAEASGGVVWFRGDGGGAVRFDAGAARWSSYADLLFQGESDGGQAWFLTRDSMVLRRAPVAPGEPEWSRYDTSDGVIDTLPNCS